MSACGAWLLLVPVCFGEAGMFVETGSLNTARFSHTATLLPNGKVLVAGGMGLGGVELGSAELYDPESGTWTFTGSLVNARDGHIATLLTNGKVLVAGGYGIDGPLASAELYDPASGMWSPTGHLRDARYYFTATLLPNGKVLVAGGSNPYTLASAELYDPQNGTWTPTGSLRNARASHPATLLPNGKVLVSGGFGPICAQTAELYDPESGTWTLTGSLVWAGYHDHTATLLPNGKVLLAGHNAGSPINTELYDPANGTWTYAESLVTPRYNPTATLLANGTVLVVAGGGNGHVVGSGEIYSPMSETWSAVQNEVYPGKTHHTATLLSNGQVLVAGGSAEFGQVFNSAQVYIGEPVPPVLLNISTRMRALTDDNALIAGFIIPAGNAPKRVIVRGIGPSLALSNPLVDPIMELHGPAGFTTITNDNWRDTQAAEISATGLPLTDILESAIVATLNPGPYTAILRGKNGGIGVGLVEIYDLGQRVNSRLANISTRGFVDTGDNVMIGGVIVGGGSGGESARVLVRALGPSVPAAGALGDPTLELHDGSGALIASNDNWKTGPDGTSQQAEIEATGLAPANDLESALLQTLPAGNYTAIVRGNNNTAGVGLVEVYNLQ